MATFEPISYKYKPTVPRPKSTAKQTKPSQKLSSIFYQIQHNPNGTAMDRPEPQPVVTPANEARLCNLEIQENDATGSRGDGYNDDAELPTIEEILFTKLQQENIVTDNQPLDPRALQSKVETREHSWSVGSRKSTLGTTLGRRQSEPSEQLGSHNSSASEAEVDKIGLRVEDMVPDLGPFDNSDSAHGGTLAAPRSSDIWHDIDDFEFPESPRPRVVVQGISVSHSTNPHTSSPYLSSEPTDNCSQPEASVPHAESLSSALPDDVLGPEGSCVTSGGRVDNPELEAVGLALGVHPDSGEVPEQVLEQRRDEASDGDDTQEGHNAAVTATGNTVDGSNSFEGENGRLGAAELQHSPSNSPPDPRYDEAGIVSDDEPTHTHPDSRDGRLVELKRKRHVSSPNITTSKRPKQQAQQRRLKEWTPSNLSRSSTKRHRRLDHTWRGSANASPTGQLPSPTSSDSGAINTGLTHDCSSLSGSSGDTLPTLTEITFRPHSPHCYSFTVVIREGCEGQGVSFSQLTQLLDSVGLGRTEDIIIKPQDQHSLLLTGFSCHPLSQLPYKRKLVEIAMDSNRTRGTIPVVEIRQCEGTDFGMMAPEKVGSSSSDEENARDINNGTPELSNDKDRDLSKARQSYSRRRNHLVWSELDKQRLLAYKKEGKDWSWIFKRFPRRTEAAVRMRWSMIQS